MTVDRDYERIADIIALLDNTSVSQPSLETLAAHVHLSHHHFHRMFVRYCGVSPKQFLQAMTLERAKAALDHHAATMDAALASGLSGAGRLHDHFVSLEAVTPGEYKSQGEGLTFYWGSAHTLYGDIFLVWTERGLHQLLFSSAQANDQHIKQIRDVWPSAIFERSQQQSQQLADKIFSSDQQHRLKLWVKGTNFQIQVWRALLRLNTGTLASYSDIAKSIGNINASRAVGTAIGHNCVAYLIPCHRVIKSTGVLGEYRWDANRKKIMLIREQLILDQDMARS